MPRPSNDRRAQINLRVSPGLGARLQAAATDYGVAVNWIAGKLLTEGLDNLVPAAEFRFTRSRRAPLDAPLPGVPTMCLLDHECGPECPPRP